MERLTSQRPWGRFVQYCQNEAVTVKIITVNPGQALSVQSHQYREELWVGLVGDILATVNGKQELVIPGRELLIPKQAVHTVENRGFREAKFLEISFGHFDENDITRFSDKYGRA